MPLVLTEMKKKKKNEDVFQVKSNICMFFDDIDVLLVLDFVWFVQTEDWIIDCVWFFHIDAQLSMKMALKWSKICNFDVQEYSFRISLIIEKKQTKSSRFLSPRNNNNNNNSEKKKIQIIICAEEEWMNETKQQPWKLLNDNERKWTKKWKKGWCACVVFC